MSEQGNSGSNVEKMRYVFDNGGAFGQQGCGHNRQHCVFGAGNTDFTMQAGAALDA